MVVLCSLVGAQLATVGRVSCEVPPASVPADSRVCLGLAGRPLLDISLHYCQHHAAVCAGRLRTVETLDKSHDQVDTEGTPSLLFLLFIFFFLFDTQSNVDFLKKNAVNNFDLQRLIH